MILRALFVVLFACGAAGAWAQPQKIHRLGILSAVSLTDPTARAQYSTFTDRLRELGYVEGSNLVIEWRFAEGKYGRLPTLAGELVKAKVEVIVTTGTPATTAARRATGTIPIVVTAFGDPVMSGFAASLAKPGGNVTGFSVMGGIVLEKRLELLIEAVPGAKRIGVLVNPDSAFHVRVYPGVQAVAEKRGRDIVLVNAKNARDIEEAFGAFAARKVGAVIVGDDPFIGSQGGTIAGLALKHKLPTMFATVRGVEDGGLMAYVNDARYRYQAAAGYVDRILKGAKAGDLPIEQPTKFELVVNAKTAMALGITLPQAVLLRASRVIR